MIAGILESLVKHPHMPILLVVGLAVFLGAIGAKIFQRLRIPQVVGYIAIGILLGKTGLGFINVEDIARLRLFNFFALGVIGFMIGGELHREVFQKYGKQFMIVLFSEGIAAFLLVGMLVGGATYFFTGNLAVSAAMGLVLGAISSATAPAATVDVLWEYKTRGPLTTAVFAIVALDDGLALLLYGVAVSLAEKLTGGEGGMLLALGRTAYELIGAVIIGVGTGFCLNFLVRRVRDHDKTLTMILGALAVVIGLTLMLEVDMILSAMALGVTVANLAPRRSRESFQIVERFTPPIYVLFFVIVGARLDIGGMAVWMGVLAVVFVVGRSVGKIVGANLGARWAKSNTSIRKYLGLCLFSQAGVAIGLAILASDRFDAVIYGDVKMGDAIIMIVTATTFLVQVIGPPSVKYAVTKAGEVGLNVTEEDLVKTYRVKDVMDQQAPKFVEGIPLVKMLPVIGQTDSLTYPVIDNEDRLRGVVTIDSLKKTFTTEGLTEWLVAFDVMEEVPDTVEENMPLAEAMTRMREQDLEYMPVIVSSEDPRLVGMLELRAVNSHLSREILSRRQKASD